MNAATAYVHMERKQHLQHIANHDENDVVQDSVLDQVQNFGTEEELKVLASHKGACKQMATEVELGKGKVDTHHGQVVVDEEENKTGNQEQEQQPVAAELFNEAVFTVQNAFLFSIRLLIR